MGIIAWIALGMAAILLAHMLLPGKRSRGLIFICLTCFTGAVGVNWAASLFRAHGLFSFSAWLAVTAEAAILLLACHLAPLMTTIAELGSFLAREQAAASPPPLTTAGPISLPLAAAGPISPRAATANGTAMS